MLDRELAWPYLEISNSARREFYSNQSHLLRIITKYYAIRLAGLAVRALSISKRWSEEANYRSEHPHVSCLPPLSWKDTASVTCPQERYCKSATLRCVES